MEMKAKVNATVVKPADLVGMIKKAKPEFLGKVPENRAAGIIAAAFAQLGKQIEGVKDGTIRVPGLGNFRVKQVEREKEGKKEMVKRVIFASAKPKAK